MRFCSINVALALLAATSEAFVPAAHHRRPSFVALPATIVTGPEGKAAESKEDDLQLTLAIILDHEARSSTTSKEQFISQMEESKGSEEEESAPVDISVPYDAAAKLAFEASDKSMDYAAFKEKFEADAVADVIAKQPKSEPAEAPPAEDPVVDISVPYDAAAKLAFEASDKSMDYAAFKEKFEADAVADVISKQPIDVSIPYDAAAKLAYEASDKSMDYAAFKEKFEADAVADVIAKQPKSEPAEAPPAEESAPVDISVPYDAAAKLAFEASDKSMDYPAFKEKFEADAVADVIAKR